MSASVLQHRCINFYTHAIRVRFTQYSYNCIITSCHECHRCGFPHIYTGAFTVHRHTYWVGYLLCMKGLSKAFSDQQPPVKTPVSRLYYSLLPISGGNCTSKTSLRTSANLRRHPLISPEAANCDICLGGLGGVVWVAEVATPRARTREIRCRPA